MASPCWLDRRPGRRAADSGRYRPDSAVETKSAKPPTGPWAAGAGAWQEVHSTYLVCAQDRSTPAPLQRAYAKRAGSAVELDTGHHPFLSQPVALAT